VLVVLPRIRRFLRYSLTNCHFYVGNNPIEYVNSSARIGHVITNQLNETVDILQRHNDFCQTG